MVNNSVQFWDDCAGVLAEMGLGFLRKSASVQHYSVDAFAAFSKSQALIEFELDGTIITANANFLKVMGYRLDEIQGKSHSIFLSPDYVRSEDYKTFWKRLTQGEFQAGRFKRRSKSGDDVWIEASYNPLVNADGKVYRIIKIASDVTERHIGSTDARGQLAAISRSQAVIEFGLDGTIITANENFCQALGYELAEIKGKHHRMFVTAEEAGSAAYGEFWRTLGQGKFHSAEFLRQGKGGRQVWIQASYNPIFDPEGRPYKVVKYATDITAQKRAVTELGRVLGLLADGDLRCKVETAFPDQLDAVRLAFNQTVERLTEIVCELSATSGELRAATSEILTGANDLAERTERQASAVEQTSAVIQQLAETISANAKRTETVRQNAQGVSQTATEATNVMREANLAMGEVSKHSDKISNVIGLIDDIAFQTNLLALNASVEAARAGEAGKGFSIVAVEVRRLAQSAASASNDVKELIEKSGAAVINGSRLVAAVGEKLSSMVERATQNTSLVDEIARASADQASAIRDVNIAVQQMDEVTQHNAALVEETNSAIAQTESQAGRLDALVDVFVFDNAADQADIQYSLKPKSRRTPTVARKPMARKAG